MLRAHAIKANTRSSSRPPRPHCTAHIHRRLTTIPPTGSCARYGGDSAHRSHPDSSAVLLSAAVGLFGTGGGAGTPGGGGGRRAASGVLVRGWRRVVGYAYVTTPPGRSTNTGHVRIRIHCSNTYRRFFPIVTAHRKLCKWQYDSL